jgi:hypothetical protein
MIPAPRIGMPSETHMFRSNLLCDLITFSW